MAENGNGNGTDIQSKIRASQGERQASQKKTFTRWINAKLEQAPGSPHVDDLFRDLRDGNNLLSLLEVLTDTKLKRVKGKLRLHHLNNLNLALDVLNQHRVKLVNISNTDIVDGEPIPTMGLVWSIIYKFQIQGALAYASKAKMPGVSNENNNEERVQKQGEAENKLLQWCQYVTEGYRGVDVKNFTTSWIDGLAFNALLHSYRPDLFNYDDLLGNDPRANLEHAFEVGQANIGVTKLLEPGDLLRGQPDSRMVVMYLSTVYENFRDMVPTKEVTGEEDVEATFIMQADLDTFAHALQGQIGSLQKLLESPAMADKPLPEKMKELLEMHIAFSAFLEDLQSHQKEVVDLVQQADEILRTPSLPQADRGFLESDVDMLKSTWENVYDKVTVKQESISDALMEKILASLEKGSLTISKYSSNLKNFHEEPTSLKDAWSTYAAVKEFDNDVVNLHADISKRKTECELALDAFEDDEKEEATVNYNDMVTALSDLHRDLANTQERVLNNLLDELGKAKSFVTSELNQARTIVSDANVDLDDKSAILEQIEVYETTLENLSELTPDEALIANVYNALAEDEMIGGKLSDPKIEGEELSNNYSQTQEDLMSAIARLRAKLDDIDLATKSQFELWVSKVKALDEWVSNTLADLGAASPLLKDRQFLEGEKKRLKDYLEELESKADVYKNLQTELNGSVVKNGNIAEDDPRAVSFKELERRLSDINRRCLKRQESIQGYMRLLSSDQKEQFRQWQRKMKDVEKKLNALRDRSPSVVNEATNVDELEKLDKIYEGIVKDVEAFKENVDDFASFGHSLTDRDLVDETDAKSVERDIIEMEESYQTVLQNYLADRRRNQGILVGLQHAERELVDEWYQRLDSVSGQVNSMDDKLSSFSDVNESNVELVESTLKEDMQQLEVKVDNTTSFGEQLCRSPRLSSSRKTFISHDVLNMQSQWLKVRSRGDELQFAVQGELSKTNKVADWKLSLDELLAWIASREKLLAAQEKAEDFEALLKAEIILTQIVADFAENQSKVENLTESGNVLAKLFGPDEKPTAVIKNDIKTLENKWDYLKERCSAAILNTASMLEKLRSDEDHKIREWETRSANVEEWLDDAEEKAGMFHQPADDLIALEEQVSKHEELVFKLATEEKEADETLDWCNKLITEEQIMDSDKRDKVREQLRALRKRKNKLNVRLVSQQESLSSKLDELLQTEAEEMESWVISARKIDKELEDLLQSDAFPTPVTAKDAVQNVSQQKELNYGVEDLRVHIDKLAKRSRNLTKEKKLGRQKSEESKTENKRLEKMWDNVHKLMSDRLAKCEEELGSFKNEWKGHYSGWQAQAQILMDWIKDINKRLQEFGKRDFSDVPFEEVVGLERKLRDINRLVENKGHDLNDVLEEGNSMMSDESNEVDDVRTPKDVQAIIHKLKEDWDDLLSSLDIEMKRLHDHLHKRFSTSLSERLEEIDDLTVKSKTLPAVHNNAQSIRIGAERISEFINQLNRLKPRVKLLQKYSEEISATNLFSDKELAEIESSTVLLKDSFSKLLNHAEDKKASIQDLAVHRIQEETTRLIEKLQLIQEKQALIVDHEKKTLADLRKLLAAQEVITEDLRSISNELLELDTLCQELDGFSVLPEAEKGELLEKMDSLKENTQIASEKGTAEKENLYNALITLIKKRINDLTETLEEMSERIIDPVKDVKELDEALEAFRINQENIEELDRNHKDAEKLTLDINDIVAQNILKKDDQVELRDQNSQIVNQLIEVSNHAMSESKGLRRVIKAMMKGRIEDLWEWVRAMKKQKSVGAVVGPDIAALKTQIQEFKGLESECNSKKLPISYNDPLTEEILDTVTRSSMMEAEREWTLISDWLQGHLMTLEDCKTAWNTFKEKEIDLLNLLKEKEEKIKTWSPVDLEDENSVQSRLDELQGMNKDMELHKDEVGQLHDTANSLMDFIDNKGPTVNNIKSQVAEIHDCWNGVVKKILESKSKLQQARNKLRNLEEGMKEVKMWLDDTQTVLNFYTDSVTEDVVKDLIPKIEAKCVEEPLKKTALERVNSIGNELIEDVDGVSHDILESNINNLNKEWETVTTDLQSKRKRKRQGPCCLWCWRRMFVKYGYYS